MSLRNLRAFLLALASVVLLASVVACSGGGGGGSSDPVGPGDPPAGPDRSGTWTLVVTPTSPCAGDPAHFTVSSDLTQSGSSLTGAGCDADGNPATVSLTLSGANNTQFAGTLRLCTSVNANCQPPFAPFSCVNIAVQGTINGSNVSGTYTAGVSACNAQGTFTGTIS